MHIDMSDNDAIKLHKILMPTLKKFKNGKLLAEKAKELESLKKELEFLSHE